MSKELIERLREIVQTLEECGYPNMAIDCRSAAAELARLRGEKEASVFHSQANERAIAHILKYSGAKELPAAASTRLSSECGAIPAGTQSEVTSAQQPSSPAGPAQEPVAWAREWEGDVSDLGQMHVVFEPDERDEPVERWFPLYTKPVLPDPEVSAQIAELFKLASPPQTKPGWNIQYTWPQTESAAQDARPCTCHPDDNPPKPCPKKYALSECRAAALAADHSGPGREPTEEELTERIEFALEHWSAEQNSVSQATFLARALRGLYRDAAPHPVSEPTDAAEMRRHELAHVAEEAKRIRVHGLNEMRDALNDLAAWASNRLTVDAAPHADANLALAMESNRLRDALSELVEAHDAMDGLDEQDGEEFQVAAKRRDAAIERARPLTEPALLAGAIAPHAEERDGERYRWVRAHSYADIAACWLVDVGDDYTPEKLDAAIDAAIDSAAMASGKP